MDILNAVSLKQLRYFVVVAETKNFRKASAILNKSQPPLTQQIKALELILCVELFDRSARQIELTEAGEELLQLTRPILSSLRNSLEQVQATGRGLRGTVRIGLTNDFVFSPLFSRINAFGETHTETSIEIHVNTSPNLIELLKTNAVDFLVTNCGDPPPEERFIEATLLPSRIIALVPDGHRFARKKLLPTRELDGEALVVYPSDSTLPLGIACNRLLSSAGVSSGVRHITTSISVALRLATEGQGIAFASEHSVPTDIQGVSRVALKPDEFLKHTILYPKKKRNPALTELIDLILSGDKE